MDPSLTTSDMTSKSSDSASLKADIQHQIKKLTTLNLPDTCSVLTLVTKQTKVPSASIVGSLCCMLIDLHESKECCIHIISFCEIYGHNYVVFYNYYFSNKQAMNSLQQMNKANQQMLEWSCPKNWEGNPLLFQVVGKIIH